MKNKIYKILTVVVMLSLILSLVTVNASAFERENYIDTLGEYDDDGVTSCPGSIYGPDYALIRCGEVIPNYGWGDSPYSLFKTLVPLNRFLSDLDRDLFVSPESTYTSSDYDTLKYLEFYSYNPFTYKLTTLGIYPVGLETDLSLNYGNIYVRETIPGLEYSWQFSPLFADECYFSGSPVELVVACYFDDYSPYDNITDAPKLIQTYEDLFHRVDDDGENYDDLMERYQRLLQDYFEVDKEREALISECEAIDYKYQKLLYEKENYKFLDIIFTGTTSAIVTSIQELSGLGFDYNQDGTNDVTLGGIFVLAILGAFLGVLLRMGKDGDT